MPEPLKRDLRRYQIHQHKGNSFELRIVATAPVPAAFRDQVGRAWLDAAGAAGPPLTLRQVVDIPLDTHVDKFADFVSEYR